MISKTVTIAFECKVTIPLLDHTTDDAPKCIDSQPRHKPRRAREYAAQTSVLLFVDLCSSFPPCLHFEPETLHTTPVPIDRCLAVLSRVRGIRKQHALIALRLLVLANATRLSTPASLLASYWNVIYIARSLRTHLRLLVGIARGYWGLHHRGRWDCWWQGGLSAWG